jgi:ubiquinone/menaquinone biosynthesis C-methylase UbiE
MGLVRRPFQGIWNIVRFNWHYYAITFVMFMVIFFFKNSFPPFIQKVVVFGLVLGSASVVISLLVSFYIYDLSDLYQLEWLEANGRKKVLNINAGFDETSEIIESRFGEASVVRCDFYDPIKHTEISIKRARQAYPPTPKTISVKTDRLEFIDNNFDISLAILSAHEIRNAKERIQFFAELNRITKAKGQIIVIEHLRDINNFLAYTIGVFHFYSRKSWLKVFNEANLSVRSEFKITPFLTTFILKENETTH